MPRAVVSPCGISLLIKCNPNEAAWLNQRTNAQELPAADRERVDHMAARARRDLFEAPLDRVRHLSAELNGLISFYGSGFPTEARRDMHYLLHTDTCVGQVTAGILAAWLRERYDIPVDLYATELSTRNSRDFRWGVANLADWCQQVLGPCRSQGYRVIFNTVGGFKAMAGIVQNLGMIWADELVYIFESGGELIRIPQLAGNPLPPSTHELDAWADQDARRIFCHWENDPSLGQVLVLDRLGPGLGHR